jgi:superfamily II DNA helicase RecQ
MKCKVFKIHLENDFDETNLNKFLENVTLNQIFASIVNDEKPFWSMLVLYEDKMNSSAEKPLRLETVEQSRNMGELISEPTKPIAPRKEIAATANFAPEPIKLNAEQENFYNAYLIAHNDSLMQMATMSIKTHDDLLQVKGLGEKRVQKYGDEILRILNVIQE